MHAFWNVKTLTELFEKLGLSQYINRFSEQEVDLPIFLTLSQTDLAELGVTTLGAMRRMLAAIKSLEELRGSVGFLGDVMAFQ